MIKFIYTTIATTVLLSGCASSPLRKGNIDVGQILTQVNRSIALAVDPIDKNAPQIATVQLDLQVGVDTSTDGKFAAGLLALAGEADKQSLHSISLTFVPATTGTRTPSSEEDAESIGLTNAVKSVYAAVRSGGTLYDLKKGSVKIQCTFKTLADGAVTSKLVPVEMGVTRTDQTIQSITLNFLGKAGTPADLNTPTP